MNETVFEYIYVREHQGWDHLSEIDLLLVCRSWEQRSLYAIETLGPRAKKIAILKFRPSHAEPATSDNGREIECQTANRDAWIPLALNRSTSVDSNIALLEKNLSQLFSLIGPTAKVVIDASSIPKFYTMSLIAHSLKKGTLCHLFCVYTEGAYAPEPTTEVAAPDKQSTFGRFTEGEWKIQPVRFLEGATAVRENRSILAFCGAEEDRIIPQLERYEDHARRVIISSGGNVAPHVANAAERRQILINSLGLSEDDIRQCDPFSVCQALALVREYASSQPAYGGGIVILPFSTKPHAIASAIAGFNSTASVFSRIPSGYSGRGVFSTGRVFSYHLVDLSHPNSLAVL